MCSCLSAACSIIQRWSISIPVLNTSFCASSSISKCWHEPSFAIIDDHVSCSCSSVRPFALRILSRNLFLFKCEPESVSCLYALARYGSIDGEVLPMRIEELALGATAIT